MESKIKKRITNSCHGRGCRIYILPNDKTPIPITYTYQSKYIKRKYLNK